MPSVVDRAKALAQKPAVAHLLRANERFNGRLGAQFTAAAAYFSVLALVPIITLAFSVLGFLVTVVYPGLQDDIERFVVEQVGRGATAQQITAVIINALDNWAATGILSILTAAYSGAGWMGNLKDAVQAQMRANFDLEIVKQNIVIKTLGNLARLFGLLVMIAITFGLAALSTTVTGGLLSAVGLDDVPWLVYVLRIAPIAVSVGAGWLLFMFLFTVLPEKHAEVGPRRRGALLGAVGLLLLQYATGLIIKAFSGNAAVGIFGPVITLLLFFNLFARLILFVAAWIATANEPAFVQLGPPVKAEDIPAGALADIAAAVRTDGEPDPDEPAPVSPAVAARTVRIGMGAGYLTGAATGLGLGALAAYAAQSWRRWRHR